MGAPLGDQPEPLRVLYYGDGGTGKTTDLCAMARAGKIWVANAEAGIKRRALEDHDIPIENIEVFPGPGEELTNEGLVSEWRRIREELNEDPTAYVGVGIDSITEVQAAMKDLAVADSVAKAARAGRERSPWVVDQDNWVATNEQTRQLLRKFSSLPCHFAATALARRVQDESSTVYYRPSVTPGLAEDINLWFDAIAHTSVVELEGTEYYRGLFRAHGKFRGKDRLNAFPKFVISPTFDRLLEYVQERVDFEEDPEWQAYEAAARAVTEDAAAPAAA